MPLYYLESSIISNRREHHYHYRVRREIFVFQQKDLIGKDLLLAKELQKFF